jgi:hypothetical protein
VPLRAIEESGWRPVLHDEPFMVLPLAPYRASPVVVVDEEAVIPTPVTNRARWRRRTP